MLIIKIHNDSSGTKEVANYNIEVLVTTSPTTLRTIDKIRVENHTREEGYKELLRKIIKELDKRDSK